MNRSIPEAVVFEARKEFEAGLIDQELLADLYAGYADVGNTPRFVTQARKLFPDGNCGLATLYLQKKLGGKIVQGTYMKHNHTFLLVDDSVVDITADQYGGPKVYIGPLRSPWSTKEM